MSPKVDSPYNQKNTSISNLLEYLMALTQRMPQANSDKIVLISV